VSGCYGCSEAKLSSPWVLQYGTGTCKKTASLQWIFTSYGHIAKHFSPVLVQRTPSIFDQKNATYAHHPSSIFTVTPMCKLHTPST